MLEAAVLLAIGTLLGLLALVGDAYGAR